MESLPIVLVVEDEQLIQAMVEEALTEGGFDAVIAVSGEDAVALLQEDHGKYRALITDVNLGGGSTAGGSRNVPESSLRKCR
jgi:DNA-binding response OmpR family regulator